MTYRFKRGDTTITVGMHVVSDCSSGVAVSFIDRFFLGSVWGDRAVGDKMFEDLQARFQKEPLQKFLQFVDPGIPFPDPDAQTIFEQLRDRVDEIEARTGRYKGV